MTMYNISSTIHPALFVSHQEPSISNKTISFCSTLASQPGTDLYKTISFSGPLTRLWTLTVDL